MKKNNELDINMISVFLLLYKERNMINVAKKTSVTQPAISQTLKRLRTFFEDELFERTSSGLQPTPYADEIYPKLKKSINLINNSVKKKKKFDENNNKRTFNLALTEIGEIYFLPKLMNEIFIKLPEINFIIHRISETKLVNELENGTIDLAIGSIPELGSSFYKQRLFDQKYVYMMREGHPLNKKGVTIEELASAAHLVIRSNETIYNKIEDFLVKKNISISSKIEIPNFSSAPYIIENSDLVTIATDKVSKLFTEKFSLSVVPFSIQSPTLQVTMFWHKRYHKSEANIWIRNIIFNNFN